MAENAQGSESSPGKKSAVDYATIFGLLGGFALIAMALYMGGSPKSFIDIPSILIVIGGTFAVTSICFSIGEVFRAQTVVIHALVYSTRDPVQAAIQVLALAKAARKRGVLALQSIIPQLNNDKFLQKGLMMIVDGMPGEEVERLLQHELRATSNRHFKSASVLRKSAEVSPAMGLIGTLIGLVQMLGNLDDPKSIGPAMAVALLTTFYGAVLSNMVFAPLASKLDRNSKEEALVNTLYLMAAASIGKQENPRRLEMLVNSLLPPNRRIRYFD
ncbi:MAG: MotA/TolQ/ExbB proton channel family protein [Rhodospirillales bacterium]|nr:MotA/TolQ/ExbB proton channel family protein [Rhodospirillales bacterium]